MKLVLYIVFAVFVVGGYGYINMAGIDPFASSDERGAVPPDATRRGGAGGIFWYGGYAGGK